MTRGPNDTTPMGLPEDPDRTDPGEAPALSATTDPTTDPGWPPGVTPITLRVKPAANGTDPGLDPMLKAFNRPPRPPAPQPNLRPSSDGDEFAAHYASPRELQSPRVRHTADDPAVLVQLAQLARSDTSPMADPTPDAALAVQRDVKTAIVMGRKRRIPLRIMLIALAGGGLIAASGAVAFLGPTKSPTNAPTTETGSARAQAAPAVPPAASSSTSSPSPAAVTATASTSAPPPPAVVQSAPRPPPPPAPPPPMRPASTPPAPRRTTPRVSPGDQEKPATPRPAHETPNPVF